MVKTVIITGASSGIGKATTLLFARQGYNIVVAARQPELLEVVASEVRQLGCDVLVVPTDVRDIAQVTNLIESAIAYFGQIDILVNNAGIFYVGPVESATLGDWQQIINTNVWGYIHTINALLPHFLERGSGTIVNVSSIGGIDPIPYQIPYTTSKYAVTGLTKSLHAELSPKGIHVCGIYPSFIRTNLMDRGIFRGESEETASSRYELVDKALHSPFLEKSEDVANAIWKGVQEQSDVLVGTAKLWNASFQIVPGVMKTLVRQVFGMRERQK